MAVGRPPLADQGAIEEVTRVELETGLGGEYFHHPAAVPGLQASRHHQFVIAQTIPIEHEVVIIALPSGQLGIVGFDALADGRGLPEIEGCLRYGTQLAGRNQPSSTGVKAWH